MSITTHQGLSDVEIAAFQRDGYIVMRGFYGPGEVAGIRDTFMAQNAEGPVPGLSEIRQEYRPEDPLSFYPRMMHPHRHPELPVGPVALRYLLDPRIHAILRDLFGEEPAAAQSMFYFKPPGARGQDLHQDNYYLRVKPGTCIAAWLAVDDADRENGGMVVVPGSNRLDIACPERTDRSLFFTTDHVSVPEGMQEAPVDLKAGDMLFFNGSLIHGSYPNRSRNRFRCALIFHYVPAGSEETSRGYRPFLTFDGQVVDIGEATGGGPCGTPQSDKVLH